MHPEDNKTTLLVLSPGFPVNETDTTCLPAQQSLIRSFNQYFPEVQVIILTFEYPHTSQPYTWFGNEVIPFNGRNKGGIARWLRWIRIWVKLARLKRKYRIKGILSFWLGQCSLMGNYFGRLYGLKQFTWILGQDARKGNQYIKWISPNATSLIAMSDFLANELFNQYGVSPAYTISNGIDPALYPHVPLTRDIDIIGVGSLIPLKQYDIFIEVVRMLHQVIPNLKVILCGEGNERNRLSSLIQQYGLEDTITLTGEKTHTEVLQLMQRSKLMLHPSSYEGFSGACLEALYAGAHVISFQQPMNGWIRHWHLAADTASMKELTLQLLSTEDLPHDPVLPYTMEDTAKAFMELYSS